MFPSSFKFIQNAFENKKWKAYQQDEIQKLLKKEI